MGEHLPHERAYITHAELEAGRGASHEDLSKVEGFARACGLDIVEVSAAKRMVTLSGTISQLEAAFRVKLAMYRNRRATYRGRTGHVRIPRSLINVVVAVVGLDDRPQARPHMRCLKGNGGGSYYYPIELPSLYDFPSGVDGSGQCIAIIELGGGYRTKDLQAYFSKVGVPMPRILAVSVGRNNAPTGSPSGPDGEVMLDIEVAGSVAPGAQIAVYFAPNSDKGFLGAVQQAVHDAYNDPSVISVSWGDPESKWTAQTIQAFNGVLQDAAALGITVCCSSGDAGSSDGEKDGFPHVSFPASSPYVLACGGTQISTKRQVIIRETAWNKGPGKATGGGVSDVFDLPAWQAGAGVPPSANPGARVGRGVPDVSAFAADYAVFVDGHWEDTGGTSAVAPLWAGLIAQINQSLRGRVGYINPLLYGRLARAGVLRDITEGTNGAYKAGAGWDACTGLGSPIGTRLQNALMAPRPNSSRREKGRLPERTDGLGKALPFHRPS